MGKNTVVLVNKADYSISKQQTTIVLTKTNRIKLETLLLIFHPLICKVLSLKPELEQNMLQFPFA